MKWNDYSSSTLALCLFSSDEILYIILPFQPLPSPPLPHPMPIPAGHWVHHQEASSLFSSPAVLSVFHWHLAWHSQAPPHSLHIPLLRRVPSSSSPSPTSALPLTRVKETGRCIPLVPSQPALPPLGPKALTLFLVSLQTAPATLLTISSL